MMLVVSTSSQASQLPQNGIRLHPVWLIVPTPSQMNSLPPLFFARHKTCGSWLVCESGASSADDAGCVDVFAGKPAPTERDSTTSSVADCADAFANEFAPTLILRQA